MNINKLFQEQISSFDTDASTVICNNNPNINTCNNKPIFEGTIQNTDKHYAALIGGNKIAATGMGTVRWCWKDDTGKQHTTDIHDVFPFPQSQGNNIQLSPIVKSPRATH